MYHLYTYRIFSDSRCILLKVWSTFGSFARLAVCIYVKASQLRVGITAQIHQVDEEKVQRFSGPEKLY